MNQISRVHIVAIHEGQRFWLRSAENKRNRDGVLFLDGHWTLDPSLSKVWDAQTAAILRRRFSEESGCETRITLVAGDAAEFVEE
jgi:phage terminase large subunit GpA-like protein